MADSEYRTYESAYEATRLTVSGLQRLKRLKQDLRKNDVDPTCHQLLRGLCLERARDGTLRLWTPWGVWEFCLTDLQRDEPLPDIGRLKLLAYETGERQTMRRAARQVFAVHQAGSLILPYPRERTADQLLANADASRRWHDLGRRHASRKGTT